MHQAVKRKSLIPIPVEAITTNTDYPVSSSKTPRITSAAKAVTSRATITAKSAGSSVTSRVTAAKSTSTAASSKVVSTKSTSAGLTSKPCLCTTCSRSRPISPRFTQSNTSVLTATTYSNDRSNRLKPPVALLPASAHGRVRSPKMSHSPRGGQAHQPKSATKLPARSSPNILPTLNRVGGKGSTRSPKGRMSLAPSAGSTGKGEVKVRVNRKESLPSTSRSNPKYISPSRPKAYQPTQNRRHSTFTKIATKPGTSASLAAGNVGTKGSSSSSNSRMSCASNNAGQDKDEDRVRPGRSTSSFSIVPNIPLRSSIDVVFRCPECSREVTECDKYKVMITECNHMICHICLYQAFLRQSGCPICKHYLDHFNHRRAFVSSTYEDTRREVAAARRRVVKSCKTPEKTPSEQP